MKANELMIGDWVCTEHDSTPRQIDWIRTGEVCLFWNKVVTPPYLVPIPITPEILEKNGFLEKNVFAETMGVDELWGLEEYSCGVCGGEDDTWVFEVYEPWIERDYDGSPEDWGFFAKTHIKDIRYVHELQHALLLCGMDKKIEL